jgi:UDP-GlcNAc:undecaprenyl-phosphate GlcNAc-1-phosphate transferase
MAGILVAICGVFIWMQVFYDPEFAYSIMPGINYWGVLLAVLVMFATGLIDDFVDLKPALKFLGQIIAAGIACLSGVLFSHIIVPGLEVDMSLGWVAYPLTIFYLVAFANIINLIDGIDGLAAGISGISAAALAFSALNKGGYDAAFLSIALLGACLGFLRYNFNPAKIFMGDSGALSLGFLLGIASLFGVVRTPALVTLLIPVIIAGIAVLDTFTSIIRRLRTGQSIAQADGGHIHHRFIALGYSQRTTVLIMYLISILLAICGVLIATHDGLVRYVVIAVLAIIIVFLIWRLGLTKSILSHYYFKRPSHEHQSTSRGDTDDYRGDTTPPTENGNETEHKDRRE